MIAYATQFEARLIRPDEVLLLTRSPSYKAPINESLYWSSATHRRGVFVRTHLGRRLLKAFGAEWFRGMCLSHVNDLTYGTSVGKTNLNRIAAAVAHRHPLVVATVGLNATKAWETICTVPGAGSYYRSLAHVGVVEPWYPIVEEHLWVFAERIKMCRAK